nr:MAG: hypothetical protein [Bacteriophage sp.]
MEVRMAGNLRAIINDAGNVDRFIDVSGNVIYIEPKNYTEAVNLANSAATKAETAASSANSAASGLADIKQ